MKEMDLNLVQTVKDSLKKDPGAVIIPLLFA